MPFYTTDNLTSWFFTIAEEYYEFASEEEQDHFFYTTLNNCPNLKDWCADQLDVANNGLLSTLKDAILNSVEWGELYQELFSWLEAKREAEKVEPCAAQ